MRDSLPPTDAERRRAVDLMDDAHANADQRPPDPAGSRPRHDPASVLPSGEGPLLGASSTAATFGTPIARSTPAAERPELPVASEAEPQGPVAPPHAARFQFLFGVLLAVGAAAIALFVATILHDDSATSTATTSSWAAWAPAKNSSNSVPQQIAAYVAPRYRLDQGQQVVLVDGGPLKVADLPLTVAIRATPARGGGVTLFQNKKSVLYRFCGLGSKCAIAPGKPSAERHLLLRREALELALYTFHYTDADQVVVFMPPRPGAKTTQGGQALFFQRDALQRQLHQPLDSTLTDDVPRPGVIARSSDRLIVDQQTFPALYDFSLQQANQDNSAFLVLDPIPASSLVPQQPSQAAKGKSKPA